MKKNMISLRVFTNKQAKNMLPGLELDHSRLFLIDQNKELRGSVVSSLEDLPCIFRSNYEPFTPLEANAWGGEKTKLMRSKWKDQNNDLRLFKQWVYQHLSRQGIADLMKLALMGHAIARTLIQEHDLTRSRELK